MPASNLISKYKKMLRKLLPRGPIWDNINSTFDSFLESLAVEPARIEEEGLALMRESNPATSTVDYLLTDYEDMALLPEEKPVGGETETQRQQVVAAKLNTIYPGPTKQFYTDLAATLGMTIVVKDLEDVTGVGGGARVEEARVEEERVADETDLFLWEIEVVSDPNSQLAKLQTMVDRLKPAHTEVQYT